MTNFSFIVLLCLFVNENLELVHILLKMGCHVFICVFVKVYPSTLFIFVIVETYWNSTKKMTVFIDFGKSFMYTWMVAMFLIYIFTIYHSWAFRKRLVVEDCLFHCIFHFYFALYIRELLCSWEILYYNVLFLFDIRHYVE